MKNYNNLKLTNKNNVSKFKWSALIAMIFLFSLLTKRALYDVGKN